MEKSSIATCLVFVIACCSAPEGRVERIKEDGVEVVLNPRLPPRPVSLALHQVFSLDTEGEDLSDIGLTMIGTSFDMDSEGSLYLFCPKNKDAPLFKFDRDGAFVRTFSRIGQGPGEIQSTGLSPVFISTSPQDDIVVTNTENRKLIYFSKEGELIKEKRFDSEIMEAVPLPGGQFVAWNRVLDGRSEYLAENPLGLYGPEFESIRELDRQRIPNPMRGKRLKGTYHIFSWSMSGERIYSGFQERGYEIYLHDFQGALVRKIRKEYTPVPVSEEYKRNFMKLFEAPLFDDIRGKIYFPEDMPPFSSLFADDEGRLFVMTYETVPASGENIFDVFDADGRLTARMRLKVFHDENGCHVKARNGRLYCLAEKANGYKELVVYEMQWTGR